MAAGGGDTPVTCPACGSPVPEGARYCPNCAAPLTAAAGTAPPPAPTAPPPPPPAPAPARRRLSGGSKALIIAGLVAAVAVIALVVYLAVGFGKAKTDLSNALTPQPGRPAGYHGPAYPGMIVQDHVARGPGASIEVSGQTLTAGALTHTASLLGPTLCTPVTMTNNSSTVTDVGPEEWKLQDPDGTVETFAITGSLQGGQIAPGGSARGTVCFSDNGQSGTFVLLWQPLFQVARGVWLLHL